MRAFPDPSIGGSITRSALFATALVATALVVPGCSTPPTATFRQNYQSVEAGDTTSTSLTELLEIGAQGEIGPDVDYRFSDRISRRDATLRNQGRVDETTLFHQASLDTVANLGNVRWSQGYEVQQNNQKRTGPGDNDRTRWDFLQQLEWEPVDLPKVTARVDTTTEEDDLFVDRDDIETLLRLEEERGPFRYAYSFEVESQKEHVTDSERSRTEHTLEGRYQDSFFDDILTVTGNLFLNEHRVAEESPGDGGAFPPGEVSPLDGLFLVDTTPEISMLPPEPRLIDGDLDTSTGINIGGFPGGGTDRNIGVELPSDTPINLVLLHVRDDVDAFFVQQFSFSVWTSEDNNFWQLAAPATAFTYERPFRRFRILIPEVTGRYLKIVNTSIPGAAIDVLVTEIKVFGPTSVGDSTTTTRTTESTGTAGGSFSWRPLQSLTLTYDWLLQLLDRETRGETTQDEDRTEQGLTLLWAATPDTDLTLRANSEVRDDRVRIDENEYLYNALLDHRPLEKLDLTLTYTHTLRERDGSDDFKTSAVQGRISADLLDTLQCDLTLERNVQDDVGLDRKVARDIVTLSAFADLTESSRLTMVYRDVFADVTGAVADDFPDPDERTIETRYIYQPSNQLTAEVELEWSDTFSGNGLDQIYRVDWIPFPDGQFHVQLDAQRQTAGLTDDTIQRYLGQLRYTPNPRAFLEISVATENSDEGDRSRAINASLNLTF